MTQPFRLSAGVNPPDVAKSPKLMLEGGLPAVTVEVEVPEMQTQISPGLYMESPSEDLTCLGDKPAAMFEALPKVQELKKEDNVLLPKSLPGEEGCSTGGIVEAADFQSTVRGCDTPRNVFDGMQSSSPQVQPSREAVMPKKNSGMPMEVDEPSTPLQLQEPRSNSNAAGRLGSRAQDESNLTLASSNMGSKFATLGQATVIDIEEFQSATVPEVSTTITSAICPKTLVFAR